MGSQQSSSMKSKPGSIVDLVLSGKFSRSLERKDATEISTETEKIDLEQPLKDIATDLVVKEFFKTESSLYSFMFTVYNYFTVILDEYRRRRNISDDELFFIYKGGNILRIVSKEFWLELPANTTREMAKFYAPYFRRSDSDFTIYLSPHINNYDKIYDEVGLLSYLVLYKLRKIFLDDLHDYFDYFKYNDDFKRDILEKYLHKFNHTEGFKFEGLSLGDIATSKYKDGSKTGFDTGVFKKSNDKLDKIKIYNSGSCLINSYNNGLEFIRGADKDRKAKFTLARTKLELSLLTASGEVTKIGGELIDVTIQHREDVSTGHFFEYIDFYKTVYKLSYMDETLSINSYTIDYLIYDLEEILFKENVFPWEDKKYHKRLYRLFYMYFVDIFINVENGDVRVEIFDDFDSLILSTYRSDTKNIKHGCKSYLSKYEQYNIKIVDLIHALYNIYKHIEYIDDEHKVGELIVILSSNNDFVLDTINKKSEYCKYDGLVEEEDIYTTSSKVLL